MTTRINQQQPYTLEEAVALLLPLCTEVAGVHAQGYGCLLHGSNVELGQGDQGLKMVRAQAAVRPTDPRDQACLAPELGQGQLGGARASIYAIGAFLYEMVTCQVVGVGMARPRDLIKTLPQALESLLSACLITDPKHRPGDLDSLARSLHHLVRKGTVPPPAQTRPPGQYGDAPVELDVSLSLLPAPKPAVQADAYGVVLKAATSDDAAPASPGRAMIELRAQLEQDPRPRYFVMRAGMDHGPFTALELAHHIDAGHFEGADVLVDNVTGKQEAIDNCQPFGSFAEHARREKRKQAEQAALASDTKAEVKSKRSFTLGFGVLLVAALAGIGFWYQTRGSARDDSVALQGDEATEVESDSSLTKKARKRGAARRAAGGSADSGQSCEAAFENYVEDMDIKAGPDLTKNQLGAVLGSGSYLGGCDIPSSMSVKVCAAVQNGRAVGVTVRTNPSDSGKEACVARAVRGLHFPSHPKMDKVTTTFD